MSDLGGDYSYEHSSTDLNEALLNMVVVDALVESSFAGVTVQVQVYGCIGMANTVAVSDMARNGFLDRPVTSTKLGSGSTVGLFHGLPEELRLTAIISVIEMTPVT